MTIIMFYIIFLGGYYMALSYKLRGVLNDIQILDNPGIWYVSEDYRGNPTLIWECEEEKINGFKPNHPWELWGGNDILKAAGVNIPVNTNKKGTVSYSLNRVPFVHHWLSLAEV